MHDTVQFHVYPDYSNACKVLRCSQFLCAIPHTAVHRYWTSTVWTVAYFLLQVHSSPCGAAWFRTVPVYFTWIWTSVHLRTSADTHVSARLCSMIRCREVSCGYIHCSHTRYHAISKCAFSHKHAVAVQSSENTDKVPYPADYRVLLSCREAITVTHLTQWVDYFFATEVGQRLVR